jgi:hypothetical protein
LEEQWKIRKSVPCLIASHIMAGKGMASMAKLL